MLRNRFVTVSKGLAVITFTAVALLPVTAVGDSVPASIMALLPSGATPGRGNWEVFETEFGKTFGSDMQASSFSGQRPSCVFAGTTEFYINLKGDTAWENAPMLDMAISIHQEEIVSAPAAMSSFISAYIKDAPDVVSVGEVRKEQRAKGNVVYVEYKENCSNHPNGTKTRLKGFARRGATQLQFNFVIALDSAAATAMADEIFDNFDRLDIAALTR